MIHQSRGTGVGNWELNRIASYTAGTITTSHALINTYTDSGASQAQVRVLKQYSAVTIDSGQTYTTKSWDKNVGGILAFFCNGETTITGNISASNKGYLGWTIYVAYTGEGTVGDSIESFSQNGSGGGGAAADNSSGGGGHATAGGNGNGSGQTGQGGATSGNAELTSLTFGGAAGAIDATIYGVNGGGIICIFSRKITITGTIANAGQNGSGDVENGAGGGAGGAILLKGKEIVLGSVLVTAAAGTGATGSTTKGGDGSVGRIHADYSTSISGSTTPTIDSTQDSTITDSTTAFFQFL